ncbi:MAG: TonB-dependent receptor [Acidobacteriota bacterium]
MEQHNVNQNNLTLKLCAAVLATFTAWGQTPPGQIVGSVFDATNGQPAKQVTIRTEGPAQQTVELNQDGTFKIALPPGKYILRLTSPHYLAASVEDVEVKSGETFEASTVMAPKGQATVVEVTERLSAVSATAEAALTERKLAAVVSDSISNEELRQGPASDAAAALEKVTGVSVVDNGYVYVRGLGERYSSTMLNNAILPTTEPERRVVPLDLFPASLIDNIKVLKTYSPDLPGEFSGGLVQMTTVEFPSAKTLNVSMSYGFNTETTFSNFLGQYGGTKSDAFGFGSSSRGLPGIIPSDKRLFVGNFTDAEFQKFGRSLPVNYELKPVQSMRPSQTYSVSGGNTYGKLGVVGALTFTNTPQHINEARRFLVNGTGGKPQLFSDYSNFNTDTQGVRLGAVLNAAYRLNAGNKLMFRNTLTRDTDQQSRQFVGLNGGNDQTVEDTRTQWVERQLYSVSAEGEHSVERFGNSLFFWQFTYSLSNRDEPDLTESVRGRTTDSTGAFRFLNLPESGLRFFSKLNDRIYEPQGGWTKPFFKGPVSGVFKVGFRGTVRRRDFDSRRFRFFPVRAQTIDFNAPTNTVLGYDNIRPDGFVMREITRGTDKYTANMDVYGGFSMVDLALGPKWRLVAGVRIEDADITVRTIDPLVPGAVPSIANLANRDWLPSVNAIYALTKRQNLRFSYGRTVNRPDFRELSPFEFTNIIGGYSTVGNPDLQRAVIDNYDARWEWFLGGNQLLAASYFHKRFKDPIEQIYRPTASELRQSFINVAGAVNQGVELEYRQGLGRWNPKLRPFALQTNFTFVDSTVDIPVDRFPQLTSRERPLVGQSRYLFNVITEWNEPKLRSNARFYVNSVARRLTDVGTFRLPDVYQERQVFMDLVYQVSLSENGKWSMRFSAENLGNNRYKYTQADFIVRDFQIGRTFTVGTSYRFF